MADADKVSAAVSFLKRTKSQSEIEATAVTAFTAVMDGTKVISVTFEGGGANSQVYFDPSLLLEACEAAIADLIAVSSGQSLSRAVFPNFNSSLMQT